MKNYFFTSESVTEGHPDKVADRISDAILDAYLKEDRKKSLSLKEYSRVAIETIVFTGGCILVGQLTSRSFVNIPQVVRNTIREIGYDLEWGYDPEYVAVITSIDPQSPDIATGVDNPSDTEKEEDLGAGDQGMMFGFATDETTDLMPATIILSHRLAQQLAYIRKNKILDYLGPDGKTQTTIYYENSKPKFIKDIVISTQHKDNISIEKIRKDIIEYVVLPTVKDFIESNNLGKDFYNEKTTRIHVNPTGRFVIGGPRADSGLTGRKVIVDTYGGFAHGGGSFSGKDPTKVDRSGAYMARYIAKNIVAAKIATKAEVQLAYVIGEKRPVSVYVNTFGTGKVDDFFLSQLVQEIFDLTPTGIIKKFDLFNIEYTPLSAYGHFGRKDLLLPWEKTDAVEILLEKISVKDGT
ncbi:MAG: methionine adenosyltransferase [Candidatus Calescibacterium sp.]|nr:methionine adenosyltransferase [Candidatus Calescibacterium sp.]MCX7972342.1 methionine adenosyltransferase [bacterium]MDW8195937.1 methionine adenosyltransferase [Candidatus Calescibacterium sp.]